MGQPRWPPPCSSAGPAPRRASGSASGSARRAGSWWSRRASRRCGRLPAPLGERAPLSPLPAGGRPRLQVMRPKQVPAWTDGWLCGPTRSWRRGLPLRHHSPATRRAALGAAGCHLSHRKVRGWAALAASKAGEGRQTEFLQRRLPFLWSKWGFPGPLRPPSSLLGRRPVRALRLGGR